MGVKVYTIERQQKLYEKTRVLLPKIGYTTRFFYGDGYEGVPNHAPFDKIIVTAAAPYPPDALLKQMALGAIMVIPIGKGSEQIMNVITRKSDTQFERSVLGKYKFVPMIKSKSGY